jgi:HSP20 family protein
MANILRRTGDQGPMARRERSSDPFEGLQDLARWEPLRDLGFPLAQGELGFVPSFDVKESDKAYTFKADLPGLKESDVEISLTGNRLTVSGEREEEERDESDRYFAYERSYGAFSRTFTLPGGVDAEHVQAEMKNGVLTVSVPKLPEVQAKKIEIKGKGTPGKGKAEA